MKFVSPVAAVTTFLVTITVPQYLFDVTAQQMVVPALMLGVLVFLMLIHEGVTPGTKGGDEDQ